MFIGIYHLSNLITYIGIFSAVGGITLTLKGDFVLAFVALIICGVCDLFDGAFARKFSRSSQEKSFGVQIDSLADVISFGAFPVVLLYQIGLNNWYHICLLVLYVFALITRLAYFNLSMEGVDTSAPVPFYYGLPVTYAALIFPLFYLLSFALSTDIFNIIFTVLLGIVALAFVLKIKLPKPRGYAYILFALLAIGTIIALLVLR